MRRCREKNPGSLAKNQRTAALVRHFFKRRCSRDVRREYSSIGVVYAFLGRLGSRIIPTGRVYRQQCGESPSSPTNDR